MYGSLPLPTSTFLPRNRRRERGSLSDKCIKLREKEIGRERKRERERDRRIPALYVRVITNPSLNIPTMYYKEGDNH